MTNNTALMIPPKNDDHTPSPRARPGLPERARGKPSKVVATEDGVPGMPVNMPDINPPDRPPTNTPIMVASPSIAGRPKVNGKVSTTAMVMVKPGIDPAIRPAVTPRVIKAKLPSAKISPKAPRTCSIMGYASNQTAQQLTLRQNHPQAEGENRPHQADRQDRDGTVGGQRTHRQARRAEGAERQKNE